MKIVGERSEKGESGNEREVGCRKGERKGIKRGREGERGKRRGGS